MNDACSRLLDRFYQEFWAFFILTMLLYLLLVFTLIFYLINFKNQPKKFRLYFPALILAVCLLVLFLSWIFSRYHRDYIYIKNNAPLEISGVVIDWAHKTMNDGNVDNSWPIVRSDDGTNEIALGVLRGEDRLYIGQKYQFIYLPNTKLAEVVE